MSSNQNEQLDKLMFQPFASILNPGFWQQLTSIKLNKLKLSKDPIDINGSYSCNLSDTLPCLASFDHDSFNAPSELSNRSACPLYGQVTCTNMMQEFLDYNKKEFLDGYGKEIWQSIIDGRALLDPERYLSRFGLLVYADLKKYKFFYWFSFPALNYPLDIFLSKQHGKRAISDVFSSEALQQLQDEYNKPASQRSFARGYFIVKHFKSASDGKDQLQLFNLAQYKESLEVQENQLDSQIYFAFSDPSSNSVYPGWPLRNYLCLIAYQYQLKHVKVIRIRKGQPQSQSRLELHHSSILELAFELDESLRSGSVIVESNLQHPHITGWEKNESQQLAPKRVNLSSLLDPKKLAEDAVNLNLKLMKWRLLPKLDLDKIASTKCLILGCGTLGCHVTRGLLAWGIKDITIVDNARISYSNPVRQTLYTFDDCVKSAGSFKAEAAAASLKRIHPSVNVKSYVFSIPMPGHHIADKEIDQTRKDICLLESLIEEHDVVFLLMDTRESRWLPTVIAMSKQTLVINAAIGFDTFLLQRYGIRNYSVPLTDQSISKSGSFTSVPASSSQPPESSCSQSKNLIASSKLGCYFCNDIVAPGDSTLDRTLDQQCTVSRPGVSMMVSALAVELLASIISSDQGPHTPALMDIQTDPSTFSDEDCGSELGIVPHSIRGNLARFHIYMPTSPAFNKCSACSPAVVNAYKISGYEFLQRVFDDPSYLEEVAGLKDLQNFTDNLMAFESDEEIES